MPYTDVKKYHPEPVLPTSPAFSLTVSPSAVVSYVQALKYTAPPEVPPPPSIKYMYILNTKLCSSLASYRSLWLSQFELNSLFFPIAIYLKIVKVFILSCPFSDAESQKAETVLLYLHLFNNSPLG